MCYKYCEISILKEFVESGDVNFIEHLNEYQEDEIEHLLENLDDFKYTLYDELYRKLNNSQISILPNGSCCNVDKNTPWCIGICSKSLYKGMSSVHITLPTNKEIENARNFCANLFPSKKFNTYLVSSDCDRCT